MYTNRIHYKNGLYLNFLELTIEKTNTENKINLISCQITTDQPLQLHHPFQHVNSSHLDVNTNTNTNANLVVLKVIVCDNELTQTLLKLIMTEDEELYTKCGYTEVQTYRSQLIKFLFELREPIKFK